MDTYKIAYDKSENLYYVYEDFDDKAIIYKGSYTQCLVIVGALTINDSLTIDEIRGLSDNFI